MAGFTEIARPEWLDQIISWQNSSSGCYYKFRDEILDPENFNPLRYGNYRKRSEALMTGGGSISEEEEVCLSHRTGVALYALAAFTRRFVEQLTGPFLDILR